MGCWEVLRDEYNYYFNLLLPAIFGLTGLAAASAVVALLYALARLRARKQDENRADESFRVNRSQPFDAWHKAVFA